MLLYVCIKTKGETMRAKTIYINKKTKEQTNATALWIEHREEFDTAEDYERWVEENYEEREIFIETPYERTRASVYATGNKWAIENFNATHN